MLWHIKQLCGMKIVPQNAMEECTMPWQKTAKTQDAINHNDHHAAKATKVEQVDCSPPPKDNTATASAKKHNQQEQNDHHTGWLFFPILQ